MNAVIPYIDLPAQHRPIEEELVAALRRVLAHGQFILGPEVAELEQRLAERLGVAHVVAVGNGTAALVLALRLRAVGPGDAVIVPSHSFVASATAVRLVGATPIFADVDPETMLVTAATIEAVLTSRVKAVMPVHLNGYPCELDAIAELCARRRVALIEDCAQAIGARHRGRSVGSHEIGCFSLHPLKVLSALGDGGFISVAAPADAARLRLLRNIGLRDRDHCELVSGNSRLDTLQAAFLLVKLGHLDGWIAARRAHAAAYAAALAGHVQLPPSAPHVEPVWSAFVVRHPRRDVLAAALRERGIDAKSHYPLAIHQQAAFEDLDHGPLPVTERVVSEILSLPVTPELGVQDRARVIDAVIAAVKELA